MGLLRVIVHFQVRYRPSRGLERCGKARLLSSLSLKTKVGRKKMNARYFQTVQIISKGNLLFSFLLQLEGLKEALPVTQSIVCRSSDDL